MTQFGESLDLASEGERCKAGFLYVGLFTEWVGGPLLTQRDSFRMYFVTNNFKYHEWIFFFLLRKSSFLPRQSRNIELCVSLIANTLGKFKK